MIKLVEKKSKSEHRISEAFIYGSEPLPLELELWFTQDWSWDNILSWRVETTLDVIT